MKPGYTTMGHKSGNATGASNGATPKAHMVTKKGAENVQTYGTKNCLKSKGAKYINCNKKHQI